MKRKAIKSFYADFVHELKVSDPGKWYSMAKQIGAVDQMSNGEVSVECLSGLDNKVASQKIAEHFHLFPMNTPLLIIPSSLPTCPHYLPL